MLLNVGFLFNPCWDFIRNPTYWSCFTNRKSIAYNLAAEIGTAISFALAGEVAATGIEALPFFQETAAPTIRGGLNLWKSGEEGYYSNYAWKEGDYFLRLPDQGTIKLNWKANYGALRREMRLEKPIFDSYLDTFGEPEMAGGFLRAERYVLESRGWTFDRSIRAYRPPSHQRIARE